MKAAILEAPGKLVVREIPDPGAAPLGPYDAVCELLYGATCVGTDCSIIDGTFPYSSPLPTILGHESVGRVIAVGAKVRSFRIGDLITRVGAPAVPAQNLSVTWGGFAEHGIARDHQAMAADGVPAEDWNSYRVNQVVPPEIDPRVAPMFITWRETLSYLRRQGFAAGQAVLLIGSGGTGLSFAALASALGAAKIEMIGSPAAEEAGRRAGVSQFFDYRRSDRSAPTSDKFDLVIDTIGSRESTAGAATHVRPSGRLAIYGLHDFGQLNLDELRAYGGFELDYLGAYDEAETHAEVSRLVLDGKLDASIWYDLDRPWPLSEITFAYEAVRARRSPKALIQLSTAAAFSQKRSLFARLTRAFSNR